jgi:hypothetical protein
VCEEKNVKTTKNMHTHTSEEEATVCEECVRNVSKKIDILQKCEEM